MEGCGVILLALLGLSVVILPFVLLSHSWTAKQRLTALERRLAALEKEVGRRPLATRPPAALPLEAPPLPRPAPPEPAPVLVPPPLPLPAVPVSRPAPIPASARAVPAPAKPLLSGLVNWEDFVGVKLFAWIGALLAFLGVAFFVKYSFDNNLIRPPVRVALGALVGLAALGGGLKLNRERYRFLVQALCSAGILIFYGTLFAAHGLYHLIPQPAAFALMVLVTVAAFTLSVRLDAIAVAVLGLVGGFMTPPLLSTGVDHPLGLFTYVALLDAGLVAVTARKKWSVLVPLAVAGTTFLQFGWMNSFLTLEKVPVGLAIFAFFPALFAAALLVLRRAKADDGYAIAAVVPAFVSFLFGFILLAGPLASGLRNPLLLGAFALAVDLAVLVPGWVRPKFRVVVPAAGLAFFGLLAVWVGRFLDLATLPPLLLLVLVFAALHGILPSLLEKKHPGAPAAGAWGHAFAPLALILILDPILRLPGPPALIWPCILFLGAAAGVTAWITRKIIGFAVMIVLTVASLGLSLLRLPPDSGLPMLSLLLIGGFAFLSCIGASVLLRMKPSAPEPGSHALPAFSALLPFAVLILAALRLALPDPSPLFGLAALMTILVLGAALLHRADALVGVTLAAVAALELAWHAMRFEAGRGAIPAAWYAGFFALFFAFPFAARKWIAGRKTPWVAAAFAGPIQFVLLHQTAQASFPALPPGLLALGFAAVYVGGMAVAARRLAADAPERATVLASLGGVALLFLTAVFPLQFDRQWITVGWALEGVALLWLFRRVQHEGLRIGALLLLGASFVRLLPGVNPFLLHYSERGPVPLLNWFLYTYGIVGACQFAAARLVDPERPLILNVPARGVFPTLGTILAFLLVNLEIADFFSAGERYVAFDFATSVGQDMTYSIAWALFALILLGTGVRLRSPAARYSGLGLLLVTLLKVFFYDLWQLGGLYRVGSLVGLAVVLLLVSYLYHRFRGDPPEAPKPDPAPGKA